MEAWHSLHRCRRYPKMLRRGDAAARRPMHVSWTMFHTAISAALLFPMLCIFPSDVSADEYEVEVTAILVNGHRTNVTDAAVRLLKEGPQPLKKGESISAGGVIGILYPGIQIHLEDSLGNRIVLECSQCGETAPLRFEVGNPTEDKPFSQRRGNVTYRVDEDNTEWFEILLEVLVGPEEEVMPVSVQGTTFLLESEAEVARVTVAEGTVEYGKAEASFFRDIKAGESAVTTADGAFVEQADSARLEYLLDVSSDHPSLYLKRETGAPTLAFEPPRPVPKSVVGGLWTIAGGILAGAAGAGLHYWANERERTLDTDTENLFAEQAAIYGPMTAEQEANDYYDRRFDKDVRPLDRAAVTMYVLGGAAVAGGVLWMVLDSDDDESPAGPGNASPLSPGPGSAGLTVNFTF